MSEKFDHPQVKVSLKGGPAGVDKGMASTVLWLESFPSCRTFWSCQGIPGGRGRPYVVFTANETDLKAIVAALDAFEEAELEAVGWREVKIGLSLHSAKEPELRYDLDFGTTARFKHWMKRLRVKT